jgi:hypothetical protein
MTSSLNVAESPIAQPPINVEEAELSRGKAIRICLEKYPTEYKTKRLIALAIVIAAIVFLVAPAIATGLAALSVCSFGVGLAIAAPITLLAVAILIKRIDNYTIYWSGDVARNIIKQQDEKARKAAEKLKKIEVKEEPV